MPLAFPSHLAAAEEGHVRAHAADAFGAQSVYDGGKGGNGGTPEKTPGSRALPAAALPPSTVAGRWQTVAGGWHTVATVAALGRPGEVVLRRSITLISTPILLMEATCESRTST
jgi:hypothetical protein